VSGIGGWARRTPDATAIVWVGGTVGYAELDERQRLLAGALVDSGLEAGDRIALLSSNRYESLEISTGALRAGIVPVPVNPLLTRPEIEYLIEDSGARWLFTDRRFESLPDVDRVVTLGDAYERLLSEARPEDLGDFTRGRPMHYTSGTTGSPKGVWVDLYDDDTAATRSHEFRSLWGMQPDDVHLVCSPLAHSAPHRYAMRTLDAGGTVALIGKFGAKEALAAIELFGITSTFMVPTHLERILDLGDRGLMAHDISSMRMLAHAGAPIREETKRKVIEIFPRGSVWEFYGSTEGQATRISSEEWLRKPGSVGTALPGAEVLVTDATGRSLPAGEVGEVWVKDPAAERFSYWEDPAKTASVWRDGAFTVGDLGYLDDDGYLFLTGRIHDTIVSGGVNVYPQEVEQALLAHPSVHEAVVFGVDSEEWGQEVHAAVVAAFNQPIDVDALEGWMRERLAGFKCPKAITIVDELPRTATGKLVRKPPR
jgi:long-chain acyl-CoA synthetase